MIRLVVTAEEFGATPAKSHGILRAHRLGIVTSTSLAGDCQDIAAAHAALAEHPQLGVGLALALIAGRPVASPATVASLLTPAGALRRTPAQFAVDWIKRAISPEQVERELDAQIQRARAAGFSVDHLCTRGHVGFLPGVGQIVERLARRYGIAGIRTAVESPTLSWITEPARGIETGVLAGFAWLMRKRLGALRHGPQTWGYLESDRLDEVRILEIIGRMGPGSHELICHPTLATLATPATPATPAKLADEAGDERSAKMRAEQAPREPVRPIDELGALTSAKVKTAIDRRGIVLCGWRDLF